MTKIKLCGLFRLCDIEAANELKPEYIGFVFAPGSRRYVSPEKAAELKRRLDPAIRAIGVFVNEAPTTIARLLNDRVIDAAQLHGSEQESDIKRLRSLTGKPIIQAFRIGCMRDIVAAERSAADFILLDSGGGTGMQFDWGLIRPIQRPYFLAGGLSVANAPLAVRMLHPYAVDVSSGIETDGKKDPNKMAAFVAAVRKEETI